jgi:hypothetical protein
MADPKDKGTLSEAITKELFESGGDALTEKSKFQIHAAAFLYKKLGRGAFGVIRTLEVTLTAAAHKLGGRYAGIIAEGILDGVGDAVRLELNRLKDLPEAERAAHIKTVLSGGGHHAPADPHHGHGATAHAAHGTHHAPAAGSTAAAKDAKTLMGYITRLPPDKRAKAIEFWRAFREEAPRVFALILECQAREGFLERLFERIDAFWEDQEFMAEAVKDLMGEELGAIQAEKDHKPVAKLKKAIGGVFGALEEGLTGMGVPERHAQINHGHNDHNHDPSAPGSETTGAASGPLPQPLGVRRHGKRTLRSPLRPPHPRPALLTRAGHPGREARRLPRP